MDASFSDLDRTWHEENDYISGRRMLGSVFLLLIAVSAVWAIGMAWWLR
jgi:hypothetical protein